MKKQYLVQVQFKGFKVGEWLNAAPMVGKSKIQYSKEEVEEVLKSVLKRFNGRKTGIETTYANGIGIDLVLDESIINDMTIIKTRIRTREVSEWEDC